MDWLTPQMRFFPAFFHFLREKTPKVLQKFHSPHKTPFPQKTHQTSTKFNNLMHYKPPVLFFLLYLAFSPFSQNTHPITETLISYNSSCKSAIEIFLGFLECTDQELSIDVGIVQKLILGFAFPRVLSNQTFFD